MPGSCFLDTQGQEHWMFDSIYSITRIFFLSAKKILWIWPTSNSAEEEAARSATTRNRLSWKLKLISMWKLGHFWTKLWAFFEGQKISKKTTRQKIAYSNWPQFITAIQILDKYYLISIHRINQFKMWMVSFKILKENRTILSYSRSQNGAFWLQCEK